MKGQIVSLNSCNSMTTSECFMEKKIRREKWYAIATVLLILLGLLLFMILIKESSEKIIKGTVFINGTAAIAKTDDSFICATLDWWPPDKCDYGTCSWGNDTILTLDLNNSILLNAVKAFSPLKIRIGGTLQDRVIFETQGQHNCPQFVKNSSDFLGFSQGCLPMSRWDELLAFFKRAGAIVTFGLNALYGREVSSDGSVIGAWNSSNAESFMRYTVNKGFSIHGWELGNELDGKGIGARIAADQYAADTDTLWNVVQDIYGAFDTKPLLIAPGGFFDEKWFSEFITDTTKTLQVVSHHVYNLGPGVDDHLVRKILDPSCLERASNSFRTLQNILRTSGTSAVGWVSEAGGAYNSGHSLVNDAFVSSFWYLDQLGMASSYDTKTYCRQTLIGGYYGLLNTTTFIPNPDYYSALLWHRLMGSNVLSTSFFGTKKLRVYSHCSKNAEGISVLLINLNSHTTVQANISIEDFTSQDSLTLQHEHQNSSTKLTTSYGETRKGEYKREEYHLTAKDGDLRSQVMLLNGNILTIDSLGIMPSLEPIYANLSDPITVAPFSIVFVRIPHINVTACR